MVINGNSNVEAVKRGQLKVALIASQETVSDWGDLLVTLLTGLVTSGASVIVVCPDAEAVEFLSQSPVETTIYPMIDIIGFGHLNRRAVIEKLRSFGAQVLHCLCESQALLAKKLARNLDIPYVLSVNKQHKKFGVLATSNKRLYKVVVPAESVAGNLVEIHPKLADKVVTLPVGCFVRREPVCFENPDRVAGLVTHYHDRKDGGFECLFGALRHLSIEGYEFLIAVVCERNIESDLRKLVEAIGLTESVTFVPPVRSWHEVMAAADIFVRPEPLTGFDPLLLEAMAAGSAVAACRGGVDDMLKEDVNCLMFDSENELGVMGVVKTLLGQRDHARKIAEQGQEYVRKNHSVSAMVESLMELYGQAEIERPPN